MSTNVFPFDNTSHSCKFKLFHGPRTMDQICPEVVVIFPKTLFWAEQYFGHITMRAS